MLFIALAVVRLYYLNYYWYYFLFVYDDNLVTFVTMHTAGTFNVYCQSNSYIGQ